LCKAVSQLLDLESAQRNLQRTAREFSGGLQFAKLTLHPFAFLCEFFASFCGKTNGGTAKRAKYAQTVAKANCAKYQFSSLVSARLCEL
jgi:hypothetical protein